MKNNFLKALFLLYCCYSHSQTNVTKLVYNVSNEILGDSLYNGIKKTALLNKMKSEGIVPNDTIVYFYDKKGNFVTFTSYNNVDYSTTYSKRDKLIYQFIGELSIVTAIDVTIDLEEKLGNSPRISLLSRKEKVGKYDCSIVEIQWKLGTYRYFFSGSILKIDPSLFKNFNYDQWFSYLKISKSLPLKIEKEINNLIRTTYSLVSFNEQIVDDSVFSLPKMKEDTELGKMYINKKVFLIN